MNNQLRNLDHLDLRRISVSPQLIASANSKILRELTTFLRTEANSLLHNAAERVNFFLNEVVHRAYSTLLQAIPPGQLPGNFAALEAVVTLLGFTAILKQGGAPFRDIYLYYASRSVCIFFCIDFL